MNRAATGEQWNAIDRREPMDSYMPIMWEREAFGWGITTLNGEQTIGNHYLRWRPRSA